MANNIVIRQQVKGQSTFYINRNKNNAFANWDINQIRLAFQENSPEFQHFQDFIFRSSAFIKGSRPFWIAKRAELQAMVRCIGCPNLFIIFNTADLYWDFFFRFFP